MRPIERCEMAGTMPRLIASQIKGRRIYLVAQASPPKFLNDACKSMPLC